MGRVLRSGTTGVAVAVLRREGRILVSVLPACRASAMER
jgi:hypothetical protein